jgi:hypothetical protein
MGPILPPELEQQGREVIGQGTVVDARSQEGMSHRHVGEEGGGGRHQRAVRQQGLEQVRLVEQPVRSFVREALLGAGPGRGIATREGDQDHTAIGSA